MHSQFIHGCLVLIYGGESMSFSNVKRQEIVKSLLKEIKEKTPSVVAVISQRYGVSRQTVSGYLSELVKKGIVVMDKVNSQNKYYLYSYEKTFKFKLDGLEEDVVWLNNIKPLLVGLTDNIMHACNYGFTEMLNNAIDHSGADVVVIQVSQDAISLEFTIYDNGIGIFNKIQQALSLEETRYAILELAKGKLTTDPKRHSGEGIFFTSRIFDRFYILSGELTFMSGQSRMDWLSEDQKKPTEGTAVIMIIERDSDVVVGKIFDQYTTSDDESYGFSRTCIPVHLVEHEGASLVSRSQAKRLISRFDRFLEVVLDFKDVKEIGQAFADELFRVFKNEHPKVDLIPINMEEDVKKMVTRATHSN